ALARSPRGGWHFGGPGGDRYAVFAQHPPHEVEAGGPLALEQLASPMQGLQTLLAGRLNRNGINLAAARGFQQPRGIGAVGLVAPHVGPDVPRRQRAHPSPSGLTAPGQMVGAAAGLYDLLESGPVLEEAG